MMSFDLVLWVFFTLLSAGMLVSCAGITLGLVRTAITGFSTRVIPE